MDAKAVTKPATKPSTKNRDSKQKEAAPSARKLQETPVSKRWSKLVPSSLQKATTQSDHAQTSKGSAAANAASLPMSATKNTRNLDFGGQQAGSGQSRPMEDKVMAIGNPRAQESELRGEEASWPFQLHLNVSHCLQNARQRHPLLDMSQLPGFQFLLACPVMKCSQISSVLFV